MEVWDTPRLVVLWGEMHSRGQIIKSKTRDRTFKTHDIPLPLHCRICMVSIRHCCKKFSSVENNTKGLWHCEQLMIELKAVLELKYTAFLIVDPALRDLPEHPLSPTYRVPEAQNKFWSWLGLVRNYFMTWTLLRTSILIIILKRTWEVTSVVI